MNRYRWDYPTQGTRFARTSAEAFGPYCGMRRPARFDWSALLYWVALMLVIAALGMLAL